MAFVDDYTAWIVGDSAEENTRVIQNDILPVLETWEKESGAIFESSKTHSSISQETDNRRETVITH